MGSCFAAELRNALRDRGRDLYPRYADVAPEPGKQMMVSVEPPDWMNHYHTYAIRQEFERALGLLPPTDVWEVRDKEANKLLQSEVVYQDPLRLSVFARTREDLAALSTRIDSVIKQGIEEADVFVITLGLTEVWFSSKTGLALSKLPTSGIGGGSIEEAGCKVSTFAENYENVRAIIELVQTRYPQKQIILSVSPVPLGMTFRNEDIVTANTESKCTLRAVAGQIARDYPETVMYFPAYEMATALDRPVFLEDRRHVRPEFASFVVSGFLQAFAKPD